MKRRRVRGAGRPDTRARGQGLVEFAVLIPVFLVLLLSMLDFGFAYNHNLSLEYATREGARTGSALAAGNSTLPCDEVDDYVMAAVQRVLKAPGSAVILANIGVVSIYKATATGAEIPGAVNTWTYAPGAGPTVDGMRLDFVAGTRGWSACDRSNAMPNPDSIGVSIGYTYHFITPLPSALALVGGRGVATLPMSDRTVMSLNPTVAEPPGL
jgi:Flp pilus assembly protein TadG